jgi:hypothetical protein
LVDTSPLWKLVADLTEHFDTFVTELARDIYKYLEKHNDYITSDEYYEEQNEEYLFDSVTGECYLKSACESFRKVEE